MRNGEVSILKRISIENDNEELCNDNINCNNNQSKF